MTKRVNRQMRATYVKVKEGLSCTHLVIQVGDFSRRFRPHIKLCQHIVLLVPRSRVVHLDVDIVRRRVSVVRFVDSAGQATVRVSVGGHQFRPLSLGSAILLMIKRAAHRMKYSSTTGSGGYR